jgi:hypothetical protein
MKSKTKLLIGIGFVAALCIGFLMGISVNYPTPETSDLAGTFGKAEKYHKVQMTEKDVQLRTDLVKDTAELRNMIQGLIYFSVFTADVCKDIELTVVAFKAKGMGALKEESETINILQDFSDFIKNNNNTLNSTIVLLTGFYLNDTASMSQDVEKKYNDFGNYVNGLNQKNMLLTDALKDIDNFMLTDKILQANTPELTQLKSIRDQLLIKGLQLGALIGNKKQVRSMIECAVGANGINGLNSKEGFQSGVNSFGIALLLGPVNYTEPGVFYNASSMEFSIVGKPGQIGQTVNDTNSKNNSICTSQSLCYFGKESLEVVLPSYSMQSVLASQALSSSISFNALSMVFASTGQNAFQMGASFNNLSSSMGGYLGC